MITLVVKRKNNRKLPGAWERFPLSDEILAEVDEASRLSDGEPLTATFDPYGTREIGTDGLKRWIAALEIVAAEAAGARAHSADAAQILAALKLARDRGYRVAVEGE